MVKLSEVPAGVTFMVPWCECLYRHVSGRSIKGKIIGPGSCQVERVKYCGGNRCGYPYDGIGLDVWVHFDPIMYVLGR